MTGSGGLPEGFEEAFSALYPKARTVAYRILGNRQDAEEAAAEALTRALVSWRRVGPLPYRDAWVLRVTANVAVDACRRRRPDTAVADPVDDPQEATVLRLALAQAMAALPRRQREVIALRYLVGLGEAETAECLEVSVGSVKKHGHRAMAALRRRLGSEWDWSKGEAADVAF